MKDQQRYCIFVHAVLEGRVPSVRDDSGRPFLFESETEAQREIAENAMARLQEFLDGGREFDDAITVEEYVEAVRLQEDGTITNVDGVLIS